MTAVEHRGIPLSNTPFSDCQMPSLRERRDRHGDREGYAAKLCLHSLDYAADHRGTVCVLGGGAIIRNVRQDCRRCNYGRARSSIVWKVRPILSTQRSDASSCSGSANTLVQRCQSLILINEGGEVQGGREGGGGDRRQRLTQAPSSPACREAQRAAV